MSRKERMLLIVVPLLSVPLYFCTIGLMSAVAREFFLSENGPVELGTAALFLASGAVAVRMLIRHRQQLSRPYRCLFALFAVAAAFVALEEMSYGQHLLGWQSPEVFLEHNKQDETNLHNLMGSKPSRLVRAVGSFGFPLACIVLPWVLRSRREAYRPAHWSYHLVPRLELVTLVVVAQCITMPDKIADTWLDYKWTARLGEVKELYWSAAALGYIYLMAKRQTALSEPALLQLPTAVQGADRAAA